MVACFGSDEVFLVNLSLCVDAPIRLCSAPYRVPSVCLQ
jgi:hypothetical protein